MTPRSLLRRLAALKLRTTMTGRIEGVCCGVAFGWAISREHPQTPATVEILLDDRPIGRATATLLRKENPNAAPSGYQCGFVFDLRPHMHGLVKAKLSVRDARTGIDFGPDDFELDTFGGSGMLDMCDGIDVLGWATPHAPDREAAEIEIRVDGKPAGRVRPDVARGDVWSAGATLLHTGFRFAVPKVHHDGLPHVVTAHAMPSGAPLRGKPVTFTAQIKAYLDVVDAHHAAGWIANVKAPSGAVRFDLWINGKCVRSNARPTFARADVEQALFGRVAGDRPIGFDVRWDGPIAWRSGTNRVELRRAGSDEVLHGPVDVLEQGQVQQFLETLAGSLLTDPTLAGQFDPAVLVAGREQIAHAVAMIRQRGGAPFLVSEPPARTADAPIDVIVPVYKGRDETIACVESVLAAKADGPAMELVVVNDAGPDPGLLAELRTRAANGDFTLIENASNLGFVASVNLGMRLHPDHDVVLLNSDTLVSRGWLRRLKDAALSAPNVATVTPLSNRATIFSLPRTCIDNDMPLGLDVHALDALCAGRNAGVRADVPTAMGYCMYIRRAALQDVGLFDEQRWTRGYGEENDFSLQAAARGWRHLAACDVFVQHHGSVSFGDEKPLRVQENLAKLNAIYPDYPRRIQRFIEQDPLALPRGRVNMALLRRLAPSWDLFISHGLGGGTDTAIADLRDQHRSEGRSVLLLRSTPGGRMELVPLIEPHDAELVTEYPRDTPMREIADQLAELNITRVHVHHSLGFAGDVWQLAGMLGLPYDVTLHDYYTICPRVTMIDASGEFCGVPDDVGVCERCILTPRLEPGIQRQFEMAGDGVAHWREFHAERLRAASLVCAPSRDAADRLSRSLPDVQVQFRPHVEAIPPKPRGTMPGKASLLNIAVIGAIGPPKGVDLLLECATLAERMSLPLRFVIVGYTSRDSDFAALENVEIMGRYRQADLPRLLATTQCGTALFLSIVPETYSYTLSEAWRAGMLPVALDIGALAERIREVGHGVLIPFPARAREVVGALMAL